MSSPRIAAVVVLYRPEPEVLANIETWAHQVEMIYAVDNSEQTDAEFIARLQTLGSVIYLPQTERQSHYFHVRPSDQYDAMIHIDATRALEPLEPTSLWIAGETPETYPSGL